MTMAAKTGIEELGRCLINFGADIDAGMPPPLYHAIHGNHRSFVQLLLEQKADIHCRGLFQHDATFLHLAAVDAGSVTTFHDRYQLLEVFERNRISLNVADDRGHTPLHYAVEFGKQSDVEVLLRLNIDVEARNNDGATPFFLACSLGKLESARGLVRRGRADVKTRNHSKANALTVAAVEGEEETVRFLLNEGMPVDHAGENQYSPLMFAIQYGRNTVAKILLDAGADVNWSAADRRIALHCAAADGNADGAELLLRHGGNPLFRDFDGITPLNLADADQSTGVARRIRDHMEATRNGTVGGLSRRLRDGLTVGDDDSIVRLLTCPITMDIMKDPVVAPDGYSYERAAITSWLRTNGKSPLTQQVMTVESLTSNRALLYFIQERGDG